MEVLPARSSTIWQMFRRKKNGSPISRTRKPGAHTGTMCANLSRSIKRRHVIAWRDHLQKLRGNGKRSKIRFIPANPAALRLIDDYLARAGHSEDLDGALFRPVANNRTKTLGRHLDTSAVYTNIVKKYARQTG